MPASGTPDEQPRVAGIDAAATAAAARELVGDPSRAIVRALLDRHGTTYAHETVLDAASR